MSFQIVEILETGAEKVRALVKHQNHQFPAILAGKQAGRVSVGQSFPAQVGFDDILGWKVSDDFDDAGSGIWQETDGIHLLGRIHSVLDYGDGKTIIDVYLQNGPEVFQIDAEAIEDVDLEANSGLEIIVGNLYVSPLEP